MNDSLFRKKSLDRISSPEEINDYIHVTNPSVWIFLIAIVLFLTAAIIWGVVGRIETKVKAVTVCDSNGTVCYVSEEKISDVSEGMKVYIGEKEYTVTGIDPAPIEAEKVLSTYAMHLSDLKNGEYVYKTAIDAELVEGNYETLIVTESISAISLLWD